MSSSTDPIPLLTADEMRRWDAAAIRELGIPERVLMESAGRAAARVLHALYPEGTVAVVAGRGNNGGDAVVLLRTLAAWGREVRWVDGGEPGAATPLLHGWPLRPFPGPAEEALRGAAVVVDGVLGTGSRGAPREPQAALIREMNAAAAPVVALDGPSGVDLTTGAVAGAAVRARVTVTFGAPKRGLLLHPGRSHAGRVVAVETGFPPLGAGVAGACLLTERSAAAWLPVVAPDAHKGVRGEVAVVAGNAGMGGAAILAASGALRAGAGMARVVSSGVNRVAVHSALPEALFTDRTGGDLEPALRRADAVMVGPAIGTDDAGLTLLRTALTVGEAPLLLDADALTLIARQPDVRDLAGERPLLLTPHAGEMARLLEEKTGAVLADRFGAAREAAERYRCTVLFKGSPNLVAAPAAGVLVSATGHSGVATGGMGDTLAGVAAAFLAAGCAPARAGALAAFYAGRAAEMAGLGRSLLPRDVAGTLPRALVAPPAPPAWGLPELLLDLPAPW